MSNKEKEEQTTSGFVTRLFVFAACVALTAPGLSYAQQSETGLRLQPAVIEEKADPGFTYSSTIRATNLSGQDHTYYIVKKDISGLSDTGAPIFANEGEKTEYELSSWITVFADSVFIGAGGTIEIPFSILVPDKASPGGHFGGIFLSLNPERPKETGVGIGYQVGTIINLRVSGEVSEGIILREFRTDRSIYSEPKVTFYARVQNTGNVLMRPRGPLEIANMLGKKVAVLRMNDTAAAVLPEQERLFETEWEGDGVAFGRYQVLLGLVYGDDGRQNISGTVSFWVLPLKILVPVILGIALFFGGVFLAAKLYVMKKLKGARHLAGASVSGSSTGRGTSRFGFTAVALSFFTLVFLLLLFLFFA